MHFVVATAIMVLLVNVATETCDAANATASTKSVGSGSAKPSRSLFLPKTSSSVSYFPKRTVSVSASTSTSHFPSPAYVPKGTTTTNSSTDSEDDSVVTTTFSTIETTIAPTTTPAPIRSKDRKMDRSGLAATTEMYHPSVRRTTIQDPLSVYVPGNISLQKMNAERKMSYVGKTAYETEQSSKLNTSPVTIMVHASPDKLPKIKPKRKHSTSTETKKRSDYKHGGYTSMYASPATSSAYQTKSYQTSPSYKPKNYRPRPAALQTSSSNYESASTRPNYENTTPTYQTTDGTTIPTTHTGLVNYMVRNLLMQANVMNQLLPLVQQIASQVPSVLADVEAAKNALTFSQAKDEVGTTLNNAVYPYSNTFKTSKNPSSSYSTPVVSSSASSNVYHQDESGKTFYRTVSHKPNTNTRGYNEHKPNSGHKPASLPKYEKKYSTYSTQPGTMHMSEDFYTSDGSNFEEDHYRHTTQNEKAKVTQGPYSSLQVGNKEFTLPTFKISLQTDPDSRGAPSNKLALGERPYFSVGEEDQRAAESFPKNSMFYEGESRGEKPQVHSVVNSVVPIVLQLHHSRKQKDQDQSPSVIKVVEVKETRGNNPNQPAPTIVEVVEEKEDKKPVIQLIELKSAKRKPPQSTITKTIHIADHDHSGSDSFMSNQERMPEYGLDDKYEEIKNAVLKEAAFREATFKEAARIVKNLHMDSSSFDRTPDTMKDHHGFSQDSFMDHLEHSASGSGKIEGPFKSKPTKDRFKDFFDESERVRGGGLKMSTDDIGHALMTHHGFKGHQSDSDTFSDIASRLRSSASGKEDSVPLPPNPEELGLEGAQLDILKEAIAKAMEEERKGGKPKEIHVMPRPFMVDHDKGTSDDDLVKLLQDQHKVSSKPKIHLIPLKGKKNKDLLHEYEFTSIEDPSPQNAASLLDETKKVLAKYSAIDIIRPNPGLMPPPHPHPFSGMPPHPFHRPPFPRPFPPHGPMGPRPPFPPPRPYPMGPFPFVPHGPPRGPFPMPPPPPPPPHGHPGAYPPRPPMPRPPMKRNDEVKESRSDEKEEKEVKK